MPPVSSVFSALDDVDAVPRPQYAHLQRLSDATGLFEHARYAVPRPEHGYCVDDVARGLLVTLREPDPSPAVVQLTETYLRFLEQSIDPQGRVHNRRSIDGFWLDQPTVGDWWGRAAWALGVASTTARTPLTRRRSARAFNRLAQQGAHDLHAAAYAALGAGAVLIRTPDHVAAMRLVRGFARMVPLQGGPGWVWPEPRLRYGNAAIAEAEIVAGGVLGDPDILDHGLRLLRFLLEVEVRAGHLSVAGTEGRGPGERGPLFDQQPIEVAAIADACVRAFDATGDPSWLSGVRLAWAWFTGANDSGTDMIDTDTGAGYDGLEPDGRNENQGAESTLAALSTWQHARVHQQAWLRA